MAASRPSITGSAMPVALQVPARWPQRSGFVGSSEPLHYCWMRLWLHHLGSNIGIQQESTHSSISRPWSGSRSKSIPAFTSGERLKNSTKLLGCRRRAINSSNCSAGTTTTAYFPDLVTYCGPSARARRTSSLNWALAVCNCHAFVLGYTLDIFAIDLV